MAVQGDHLKSQFSRDVFAAQSIYIRTPESTEDLEPIPATIKYYSRADWKSTDYVVDKKQRNEDVIPTKMNFPLENVRLMNALGSTCTGPSQCLLVLNKLQRDLRMFQLLDDVHFNFYIGPDGSVFEGRGWFSDAIRIPKYKYMAGNTVDIAFFMHRKDIWKKRRPSDAAQRGAKLFIKYGIDSGLIMKSAKVVSCRS